MYWSAVLIAWNLILMLILLLFRFVDLVVGVLEAELLVAGDLVSCLGLVKRMRLMCIVPSTLLTLP